MPPSCWLQRLQILSLWGAGGQGLDTHLHWAEVQTEAEEGHMSRRPQRGSSTLKRQARAPEEPACSPPTSSAPSLETREGGAAQGPTRRALRGGGGWT